MWQPHTAENPWKRKNIDIFEDSDEAQKKLLIRQVRSIFNKITPTNEESLKKELLALKVYASPAVPEVMSIIFEKSVQEPKFCSLYVSLFLMNSESTKQKKSEVLSALLVLTQNMFDNKHIGDFVVKQNDETEILHDVESKLMKESEIFEAQNKFRERKFGNIRLLGQLYLNGLVSIRIIRYCVVDLLKSVAPRPLLECQSPDEDSVECAVKLLEVSGKRLCLEVLLATHAFPLKLTFQTLSDAISFLSLRLRFLIMNLFDLRARKWVPRRAEELPRTLDEIKEEIRQEQLANAQAIKSSMFGEWGAQIKEQVAADNWRTGGSAYGKKEVHDPIQIKSRVVVKEDEEMRRDPGSSTNTQAGTAKFTTPNSSVSKNNKVRIDIPTTTDSVDELTDECCCGICSEVFDSAKFIPRSLDCGHAYCQVCIYNEKVRIREVVKCPTCQQETALPEGRVLPINYPLIGIAEKLMKSRIDPKITCKACEINFPPSSVRMCDKSGCEMFNELLCLTCALDGGHGGHVVKYEVKLERIRTEAKRKVGMIRSQVCERKQNVLKKANDLVKMASALEANLSVADIPDHIIGQLDTIASEEDAGDLIEIVTDLAATLIDGCNAMAEAFDKALQTANEQFELDNK